MRHFSNLAPLAVLTAALWQAPAAVAQDVPGRPAALPQRLPPADASLRATLGPPRPPDEEKPAEERKAPEEKKSPACEAKPKEPPAPTGLAAVPRVRLFPRTGNFFIPPKGPGYYSLMDVVTGTYRDKPPHFPYAMIAPQPPPLYDNDFRYLDDPKNTQHDLFDPIHRVRVGDEWLFNTGGQFVWRHMHEANARLGGTGNDHEVVRTRVFLDLWHCDSFRAYVELLDARTYNEDLTPALIDETGTDMLDFFVDVKVGEFDGLPAYVRVGRQEVLLGSQRLVSPPDWANVRRTFQGVRGFHQGKKFDVDLFWLQPVVPHGERFDSVDNNVNFFGIWTTYRPRKGVTWDNYYLFNDNTNNLEQLGIVRAPVNFHTLGTRYAGDKDNFLWDAEVMFQFGERGDQGLFAAATSLGAGYNWPKHPLNPTLWLYYDFASGDQNPNEGDSFNTFNQLYPFGHYYLGWLDLVGRQNIHDLNAHLYLWPTKWIMVWLQYHHFELASARDALYNAGGNAIRRDETGRAGHHVGDELDLVVNFHLGYHSDILVGYSHMFPGRFLEETGDKTAPSLFYAMYSFRW